MAGMDELMRSLEGSRDDQTKTEPEIPKEIYGVLAAHIKVIQLVASENADAISSMTNLMQLQLEVCGQIKTLPLRSTADSGHLERVDDLSCSGVCNQLKHFIVEMMPSNEKSHDLVKLQLVISSPLLPGSVSVLGKGTLFLHDIIHGSPLSGSCELKNVESGAPFAIIIADWVFCYGRLGYGESYQLKHASHRPGDYLHCSLFPRLTQSDQNTDGSGLILNPHPTSHPVFIPFGKHAKLCVQESAEGIKESPPNALMHHMTRLGSMHRQLKEKNGRRERLRFLEDIVFTNGPDPGGSQQNQDVGVTARGAT